MASQRPTKPLVYKTKDGEAAFPADRIISVQMIRQMPHPGLHHLMGGQGRAKADYSVFVNQVQVYRGQSQVTARRHYDRALRYVI